MSSKSIPPVPSGRGLDSISAISARTFGLPLSVRTSVRGRRFPRAGITVSDQSRQYAVIIAASLHLRLADEVFASPLSRVRIGKYIAHRPSHGGRRSQIPRPKSHEVRRAVPDGPDAPPPILLPVKDGLPGSELIEKGSADLAQGIESVEALLVSIAGPRLSRIGYSLPAGLQHPERRLYALLAAEDSDSAHSRYNAWIRRLVSFERAAECASR